mgnify:FL=1
MAPAVDLSQAVSLAGSYPLLAGVDLQLGSGELLLLEGENGSGKTSVLRLLAGLLPITSGTGTVLGVDLATEARSLRRRVGLVGHQAGLYAQLSVRENVAFQVAAAHGDVARVDPAIHRVGLDARSEVSAAQLSAGQRRRAALAIAIARAPELWLLDEPEAGLDVAGRAILAELLDELADLKVPVVIAAHETAGLVRQVHHRVRMAGGVAGSPEPGGRRAA